MAHIIICNRSQSKYDCTIEGSGKQISDLLFSATKNNPGFSACILIVEAEILKGNTCLSEQLKDEVLKHTQRAIENTKGYLN